MIHRRRTHINHKITIAAVAFVLSFASYQFVVTPGRAIGADAEPTFEADEALKTLLTSVNKIKALTLDDKIFTDPVFVSLLDRAVDIEEQPVGKTNPFAPFSASQTTRR